MTLTNNNSIILKALIHLNMGSSNPNWSTPVVMAHVVTWKYSNGPAWKNPKAKIIIHALFYFRKQVI